MLVSVIIPTTCDVRRQAVLRRALASVWAQDVEIELILVVNGDGFDAGLLAELRADARLKILQLAQGNVSVARFAGLQQTRGDFFCFLDDDDEFLPGAFQQRLKLFGDDVDVQVCNGYEYSGRDELWVPAEEAACINQDPIGTFLRSNWFASPAAMFRSQRVDRNLFDMPQRYFEWTLLFFHLHQAGLRVRFCDVLAYRKYEDNPLSVSKSKAYAEAYPLVLQELLSAGVLRGKHRQQLRAKYAAALNALAQAELNAGHLAAAWRAHLRCLASGGLTYLSFTRHLFRWP